MKKIYSLAVLVFLAASAFLCKAGAFEKARLYGAWANSGSADLGNAGVVFITERYAAYLEKSEDGGCVFNKYAYEISPAENILRIFGLGWFKIEETENGGLALNRTKWIIPHLLSYDGVVRREKMPENELRQYLRNCRLDAQAMKKAPIKNLKSNPLTKEEWERIAELAKTDSLAAQKEIKAKKINKETADDSLPAEIENFILQRGK